MILGLLLITGAHAEHQDGIARATFAVRYDVGANALEGRPGILAVERGWQERYEVNRVSPQKVVLRVEKIF